MKIFQSERSKLLVFACRFIGWNFIQSIFKIGILAMASIADVAVAEWIKGSAASLRGDKRFGTLTRSKSLLRIIEVDAKFSYQQNCCLAGFARDESSCS